MGISNKVNLANTLQVNFIRGLIAGLIWGCVGACAFALYFYLKSAQTPPSQMPVLIFTTILQVIFIPTVPFVFMLGAALSDILLLPFSRIPLFGFIAGFFIPAFGLASALTQIVADPFVYILWRISKKIVPMTSYPLISFSPYVLIQNR